MESEFPGYLVIWNYCEITSSHLVLLFPRYLAACHFYYLNIWLLGFIKLISGYLELALIEYLGTWNY